MKKALSLSLLLLAPLLELSAPRALAQVADLITQYKDQPAIVDYIQEEKAYGLRVYKPEALPKYLGNAELDPLKLESDYFRVVEGEGEEVLPVTDFEGRNVLYHLTRAREFFKKLDSGNPALENKITVRVRMSHDYNIVTHYGEHPSYNNSRYIPANYRGKWGNEMWFHSSKIKVNWVPLAASVVGPFLRGANVMAFINIPFAIHENTNYGMSSAFIPTVIYHEAFHWASDRDGLIRTLPQWRPLGEDLANYYAVSIAGIPRVADIPDLVDTRNFQRDFTRVKPAKKKSKSAQYEYPVFLPALLWKLHEAVGLKASDDAVWNAIRAMGGKLSYLTFKDDLLSQLGADPRVSAEQYAQFRTLVEKYSKSFEILEQRH